MSQKSIRSIHNFGTRWTIFTVGLCSTFTTQNICHIFHHTAHTKRVTTSLNCSNCCFWLVIF